MKIYNYSQEYEKDVVDLWNTCCNFDPISIQKFRNQTLLDENFDPNLAFVAVEEDSVAGFIYGTKRKFPYLERGLEPTKGWINVIFVHPSFEGKGVGQALYDKCEKGLLELGVTEINLATYSPNYYFYGLDPDHYENSISFFEKNGYVKGEEHFSMGKNLHGFTLPSESVNKINELSKEGYEIIHFNYSYCLKLLEFLKEEFGGGWKRNALISMQQGKAENNIIIITDKEDEVCGFCMREIDGNPMRFGPIGVSAKERNKGLGSVLLDYGCYEMAKCGMYRMFFMTTEINAKRYYERHGLTVIRRYFEYKKVVTL